MPNVFRDDFASGGLDLWDGLSPANTVKIAAGISGFGPYCLQIDGYNYAYKKIPAGHEYYWALWINRPAYGGSVATFAFSVHTLFFITCNSGFLQVKDAAGVVQDTGSRYLNLNQKYLLEVHASIGAETTVQVKVDDQGLDIDAVFTGVLVDAAYLTQADGFYLNGAGAVHNYFGNVRVATGGWIGDSRMQPLLVAGAGSAAQLTPSAGANYQCVDEVPASDADDVSGDTADLLDLYAVGALTGSIDSIVGLQLQARAVKEGAPTPQNLKIALRSAGTNYFGAALPVPATTPQALYDSWETNPATGVPWTAAELAAIEIGMQLAA